MPNVTFAEVNCNDQRELCNAHGAGSGGWPLIKHWSVEHKYSSDPEASGARFPRTMPGAVCDEIVSEGRLEEYVRGVLAGAAAHQPAVVDKTEL